jgi:hypothetical protein
VTTARVNKVMMGYWDDVMMVRLKETRALGKRREKNEEKLQKKKKKDQ